MKNIFIISGLFLVLTSSAYAVQKVYLQQPSYYNSYGVMPRRIIQRPVYNPYGAYYSPYQYRRANYNNARRIQRLNRIRQMDRMRRNYYRNHLTWFNNKNNPGSLTGYSVPITDDIYGQMGISPYNKNSKQNVNSPNCNQDLFSNPKGNEMYYRNGEYIKDIGGATGKTGVTIIYD